MKSILFYSLSIIFILSGCKTSEKASLNEDQKSVLAMSAINDNDFVLEADFIIPRSGPSIYVNSNTNFISVNRNKATIQLALTNFASGLNGVGGITLDGNVSNEKMSTDKKGNLTYSFNVQGTGLSASVSFNMIKGTNRCTATVTPNFSGNIVTFSGYVYPRDMSSVYKGRAL